jgi:type II secretory pathway component PulF
LLHCNWLFYFTLAVTVLLWGLALCYVGGPRLAGWLQPGLFPFFDWIALKTPWKRLRLIRHFAGMLAVLLDAGISERDALGLAGRCTANAFLRKRAYAAQEKLASGVPLPQALMDFDVHGELAWRLTSAAKSNQGFRAALAGWVEALDAKAFQQEQGAAQFFTTLVVLANGVMIGIIAVMFFSMFASLINGTALW